MNERRCIVCESPGGPGGWCDVCAMPNVVADVETASGPRVREAITSSRARIVAIDAAPDASPRIELPRRPASLIGRMLGGAPLGCPILVHGTAGAGKTSDAVKFASELAAVEGRRALLVSGEMPQRVALEVVRRAGVDTSRVDVLMALGGPLPAFDPSPYAAIVYDSANRLGADPVAVMTEIVARTRDDARHVALAIAHETTDGKVKGGTDLGHDCDAHIVITSRSRARVQKTRIDVRALDVTIRPAAPSKRRGARPRSRLRAARPRA